VISSQTNGMIERFSGRISEVLVTHRCDSREALETKLKRYSHLYNHYIPQRALGQRTPVQAMKDCQDSCPQLFIKKARNHAGRDSHALFQGNSRW